MELQHGYLDDVSAEPPSRKQWLVNGSNNDFCRTVPLNNIWEILKLLQEHSLK